MTINHLLSREPAEDMPVTYQGARRSSAGCRPRATRSSSSACSGRGSDEEEIKRCDASQLHDEDSHSCGLGALREKVRVALQEIGAECALAEVKDPKSAFKGSVFEPVMDVSVTSGIQGASDETARALKVLGRMMSAW